MVTECATWNTFGLYGLFVNRIAQQSRPAAPRQSHSVCSSLRTTCVFCVPPYPATTWPLLFMFPNNPSRVPGIYSPRIWPPRQAATCS